MELLWISVLGGALALDATSVGQFMVSRPLVSGAISGWVVGDPRLGLVIGVFLELYLLVSFPSGGARFPEGATATVVAVASASVSAAGAVPLGVAMGLLWGQVGGITVTGLRRLNARLVPEPGSQWPERVVGAHLGAMTVDFLRGTLVTLAGVASGRAAVRAFSGGWPLDLADSNGLLLVGGAVSGGILLRSLGGFRRRGLVFAAALALGVASARLL
jgi:mannose/fructose/N-acetylgalactosamine-specific phosphotransferase system component IIC